MKNKLNIVIAILLLTTLVSSSLGTYKQNECIDIKTILNSTWVNISTINSPSSVTLISNQEMTKNGMTFNYTFCDTSQLGKYIYDYYDASGNVYVNDFEITESGTKVSLSNIIIVIVFLFLSGLTFFLGNTYNQDKWMLKSFFYLSSLLFGALSVNSARIIASESQDLYKMSIMGFILIIVILSAMFLYTFIYFLINTLKQIKNKKEIRWTY
jgi:hypothetical protein